MLRIGSAVVVEQLVVGSDLLVDLMHVILNDFRHVIIEGVGSLACLEEDIRILSRTSLTGMVRIQALVSPRLECFKVNQILEIFEIPLLDLLDLMGGTETVKEIDKGKTSLDRRKMSDRGQVHNFLYGRLAEHAGSGLATCIDVRMVTEDGKCMGCKRTCGDIKYARKSLTGDLVQVGDHKKQTL